VDKHGGKKLEIGTVKNRVVILVPWRNGIKVCVQPIPTNYGSIDVDSDVYGN